MSPPAMTRGARHREREASVANDDVAPPGPSTAHRPPSVMMMVEQVDASTIAPAEFWSRFAAKRRPVILRGLLRSDPAFSRVAERWTDDAHLTAAAGDEVVEVERPAFRQTGAAATTEETPVATTTTRPVFGLGDRTRMTFREFLERKARGEILYVSTQTHPRAPEDGAGPDVYGPPLRRTPLCGEAPLVPPLCGALVPQAVNVWIASTNGGGGGSTSGLHHDYHDNLYVLVRGRKRFRLWPQQQRQQPGGGGGGGGGEGACMYPHGGQPSAVHAPSGRVVYPPQTAGSVLADGTDAAEAARLRRRWEAERGVAAAEARARRREAGARGALREAEAALEAALEAELDERALAASRKRGGGGGGGGKHVRPAAADADGGGDDDDEEDEDEDEDEDGEDFPFEGMHDDYDELCGGDDQVQGGDAGEVDDDDEGEGDDDEEGEDGAAKENGENRPPQRPFPPSFSRVDLSPYPDDGPPEAVARADAELRAQWPRFPGLAAARVARVDEGDALYLPAGWWHEVTTYCGEEAGSRGGGDCSSGSGSLALNYWFYPPDAPEDGGESGGKTPYRASGGFLPELWRRRLEWLAPRHAALRALADARAHAAGRGGGGGARRAGDGRAELLARLALEQRRRAAAGGGGGDGDGDGDANPRAQPPLLRFHARVGLPGNRYRTSTTRLGSGSGSPSALPKLSAERRERLGLGPAEEDEKEEGGEEEDGGGGVEEDEEQEDDQAEDDGEEKEEADPDAGGRAALSEALKANPELARQLMLRMILQQKQQQQAMGGGPPLMRPRRRPSRAERLFLARRSVFLAHGRRHHIPAGAWRERALRWSGPGECETRGEVAGPGGGGGAAAAAEAVFGRRGGGSGGSGNGLKNEAEKKKRRRTG